MDNTPSLQIGFDGHYVVYLWGGRRVTGAFTWNDGLAKAAPLRYAPSASRLCGANRAVNEWVRQHLRFSVPFCFLVTFF